MKIRRLEIQGFKSFVDRTVLTFDHDITAIVGPNGCGKSNTVDAIRWCMGEQSARHLRGKAMEDVIFAGSDSRPPHSFAEVTLVFDNRDGLAPVEYSAFSEIAVTRRLSRDGASDYSINRAPARLMDVVNVFLGSGAGTKAYSIVEQGRVALIVTSKSEDRRAFLEEAAGITRYKARKKAAEKKIELTRQNLQRIGDILGEIEKSLGTLKRQAQKAERYKAYRAELRELELYLAAHRLLELVAVNRVTTAALERASAEQEGYAAGLFRNEAEAQTLQRQLFEAEQALERAQNESFQADNEVQRSEGELARLRDQLAAARKREVDASKELSELAAQRQLLAAERDQLASELTGLARNEEDAVARFAEEDERMRDLRIRAQEVEARLGEHRKKALEAEKVLAGAEASRNALARRLLEAEARRNKFHTEQRSLRVRAEELRFESNSFADRVASVRTRRDELTARRTQLEASIGPLRTEREGAERRLSEARADRDRTVARWNALREVAARHEGVGKGVQALLQSKKEGLRGLLAEQLSVPPELAAAVAAVLADRWQDVSVRDAQTAVAMARWLRKEQKGRAGIVPEVLSFSNVGDAQDHPAGEGIEGMLLARLGGPSMVPPALQELLSSVVLVKSLEDALTAWSANGGAEGRSRFRYVTLDGDVLEPTGRLVGGVPEKAGAGLLSTQAELRALEPKVESLEGMVEEWSSRLEAAREQLKEAQRELEEIRADQHAQELALLAVERDQKSHEAELLRAENRLETLEREAEELDEQLEEMRREDEVFDKAFRSAEEQRDRAREGMMADDAEAQAWRGELERATALLTDAKVNAARAREKATAARNAIARLEKSAIELGQRKTRLETELEQLAQVQGQAAGRYTGVREGLSIAVVRATECKEQLRKERVRFEILRGGAALAENLVRDARTKRDAATKRVTQLELKAREEAIATKHLLDTVAEKYQVVLTKIVGDFHLRPPPGEKEKSRSEELRGLLDRMGEVNLMAIEEYAEQEKRHGFFVEQKKDLERALEQLEEAIAQMNRESRRRFQETFDAVNTNFQQLFPRLFRGGQGKLQLTNPEDLLDSGVEIVAQPPGKKLVNLEAMSGGEKTLTAVTLLFALFMYRPSPFCLLDEVEAALDEANVIRLCELVRDLTDRSQFIMITHNKRTMSMADVLYGVTMEEPGVSKLVGVKLKKSEPTPEPAAVA